MKLTHLHRQDRDVVPAHLLSVQGPHRHQRPGCDVDVEVFVEVARPLNGISADPETTHAAIHKSSPSSGSIPVPAGPP